MDESNVKTKMQGVVSVVAGDIASIRTNRAAPSMIEDMSVLVYGGTQKLTVKELATISSRDPQTLLIDPWDKSIIGEIAKGIIAGNIGLNPIVDGEMIRINIPPMTSEDREKYVKILSVKLEAGKVMIRQIRGDVMHDLKKSFEEKEISEDEKFASEKKVQEITDEFTGKIEEMGKKKEEELLAI